MKKSLMIALWFGLCVCASAAFQYEVIKGPGPGPWVSNPDPRIYGNSFTVKVTEGSGSIYILDKINNLNSMSGNDELLSLKMNMTQGNYGYVTQDGTIGYGDGTIIEKYKNQNDNNELVTQLGYKIGDFSEGDEIGIWLTSLNDKTGASILDKSYDVNSNQMTFRDAYTGTDALGNALHQLDFKGKSGSIFFGVHGVDSGKPLPGVFATLLLGGGVLGVIGMRKKRVTKA